MYFNRTNSGLQAHEGVFTARGVELSFNAIIRPMKHAPHVGADHPRFMQPGRPAEIVFYMLFDEQGHDRTGLISKNAAEVLIFNYIHRHHEEYAAVAERLMNEGVVA